MEYEEKEDEERSRVKSDAIETRAETTIKVHRSSTNEDFKAHHWQYYQIESAIFTEFKMS